MSGMTYVGQLVPMVSISSPVDPQGALAGNLWASTFGVNRIIGEQAC